ncbi:FkbM family methyltransferase [Novacetimonas pomaceti]|uniref:Methyltransferase FkbM domain-containing protein n=1 Tax=Novacetimonas pomaceti TaxID=2021998 RepID=A0ABX5P2N0_9PROT|nr:FkbM family methyltransferase [Novacetimonas pomaceti]PYD47254.1 hypothetical protein C3920_11080 [Novacetimonas pomaceti]
MKIDRARIVGKINFLINRIRDRPPVYLGDDTLLLYTPYGFYIYLDGRDDSLTPHIINNGVWEAGISRYIDASLNPGDTFVDIGANNGFHSLLAAKRVGPGGCVVAFEPQARLCTLMQRSLRANVMADRLFIQRQALGDTTGMVQLGKMAYMSGSASLLSNQQIVEHEEVPIDRLDSALAQLSHAIGRKVVPNLVKMDAEGVEYRIWCGMRDMVRDLRHIRIVTEFSPISYRHQGMDVVGFLHEFHDHGLRIQIINRKGELRDFDIRHAEMLAQAERQFDLVLSK